MPRGENNAVKTHCPQGHDYSFRADGRRRCIACQVEQEKLKRGTLFRVRGIWSKVVRDPDTECWEWTGRRHRGYGQSRLGGVTRQAHRLVYSELIGDPGPGLELHHVCKNKGCVNPAHLLPLTPLGHKKAHAA